MPGSQPHLRGVLAGVFLISLSTLAYEVALSYELAYLLWFYLSFIVIALAMFGLGAGGVLAYLLRRRAPYTLLLHLTALGSALGMLLFLLTVGPASRMLPSIAPEHVARLSAGILVMLGFSALPFLFSGAFLSLSLSPPWWERRYISFIYFADLAGAGLGACVLVALLPHGTVEHVMVLSSMGAALASALFVGGRWRRLPPLLLLLLSLHLLGSAASYAPEPMPGKYLRAAMDRGARVIETRWTAVSRTDVIEQPATGLRQFVENAEYPVTIAKRGLESRDDPDPRWLMFAASPSSMLAIGSGGGVELAMALAGGVEHVDAVEINPFIVEAMEGEMAEYSGNLYHSPAVKVHVEDGRTFLHRTKERYELIENGVIGSAGIVVPSTAMLTTKDVSVYTVEANQEYLRHLTEHGVAVTIIYSLLDSYNTIDPARGITAVMLREYATVWEALRREGLDPERHFMLLRYPQKAGNFQSGMAQAEYTLLFREALTPEEAARWLAMARRHGLEIVYSPYHEGSADLASMIESLPPWKDVSPATDDRPFFYFTDRSAAVLLLLAIAFLALLTFLFIILPIAWRERAAIGRLSFAALLFFLFIGVGYILVEATVIQRLVLLLGRPGYAFQLVLSTMLVSSGLGSMSTGVWIKERRARQALLRILPFLALLVFLYSTVLQSFILAFIHLPLLPKAAVTSALLLPLGFALGTPFPLAMRMVSERDQDMAVWMYGVNASGSVLGSILGMLISLMQGFTGSLIFAALMYAAAFLALAFSREVLG